MSNLSQKDRVLRMLQRGPVNTTDFLLPDVVDGRKPILRVAACVCQLRKSGYPIATTEAADGTATYTLTTSDAAAPGSDRTTTAPSPPVGGAAADPPPVGSALFNTDAYAPATSHYDPEVEAA